MAKLTLQIIGDNSKALQSVQGIKDALSLIEQKPIEIKVSAKGVDAVTKDIIQYAKWTAQATAEERKLETQRAKTASATAKTASATAKNAEAMAKLASAQAKSVSIGEKQANITKKQADAETKLAEATGKTAAQMDKFQKVFVDGQLTKTIQDATAAAGKHKQTIVEVGEEGAKVTEKFTTNYREQAKYLREADAEYAKYAADIANDRTNTALQDQIDSITGVSRSFKSAEESASTFIANGLTPVEKALNTQSVEAGLLNKNYGELIDSQRVWNEDNTMLIKGVDTYRDALGNVTTVTSTLKDQTAEVTVKTRENSEQMKKQAAAAEEAARRNSLLGDSLDRIVAKIVAWQVINATVAATIRAFKEAVQTLKAVDDELVTIRKVTGFTDSQIQSVKQRAFSTASAYGVGAAEYLEGVAAFSRAGYKEQSAALAELATKTQIVGDTTAEVANQFLLSVDAAYKYGGSIKELSAVLDGANELDNKYATSIEKIAEGMGIVAPVAAQMHVTIDELAAAIGTVTAVTQRSGSEAARALRALFLNIAGDTKTEIDEGVTWTTGEIEGLRDVIKLYAKDAYDAAQASEGIIDPMRAMEGLAKSMEEGVLSEQKLIEMVSDIGGKLRTSQLLAIIQNWDMYQSMLQDYAGAIGSADKEVENALDSWTRKTTILQNTWTEFISHLIDSDAVKSAIDLITEFVRMLDSGVGKVAALTVAFAAAGKVISGISKAAKAGAIAQAIQTVIVGAGTATEAIGVLTTTMLANPLFWGAVAAAAIYGIAKAIDFVNVTVEEQQEKLDELNSKYESLYGAGSEIDTLRKKTDELTEAEKRRLAVLEAQEAILKAQIAEQEKATFDTWRNSNRKLVGTVTGEDSEGNETYSYQWVSTLTENVGKAQAAIERLSGAYEQGQIAQAEYKKGIQEQIVALQDDAEILQKAKENGEELTSAETSLLNLYNSLVTVLTTYTVKTSDSADAMGEAQGEAQTLAELMKQVEDGLNEEADAATNAAMQTQFYALQAALASGQPIDTASAITSLSGLSAQSTNTAAALQALIAVFQQIESMDAQISSYTDKAASSTGRRGQLYASRLATLTEQRTNFDVAGAFQRAYAEALANMPGETSGGGGGSQTDEMLENYKQIVSLEEQRLSFLEASGASVEEQVEQVKAIQSALHDEADYLRSIEGESENVVKLSTDWWKYQDKISDLLKETDNDLDDVVKYYQQQLSLLQESGASNEQIEAMMRQIMAVLEQQIVALQQTDAYLKGDLATLTQIAQIQTQIAQYQNKINDLHKEETETAEKEEDVLADIVKLRKNELSYLEESGASTDQIAAKMREIQTALLAQIESLKQTDEYLTGNAATMAEIVSLQTQWMQYQNKIKDLYQQELQKAVEKVRDEVLELIDVQEEAAVGPLQKQLDILEAQRKTVEDTRTEEERLLAVEKARVALQNAQNERNIRQYNSKTGQWEWVANAETVSKAQSALEDAEKALADYYTEREISMLKDQISSLETEYDALRDAVSNFAQGVIDGTESYKDAAAYLNTAVYGMSDTVKATAAQAAAAFNGLADAVKQAAAAAAAAMMSGARSAFSTGTSGNKSSGNSWDSMTDEEKRDWVRNRNTGYENTVSTYMDYATMDSSYANSYSNRRDLFIAKAKSAAAGSPDMTTTMAYLDAGMRTGKVTQQEALDALYEIAGRSGIQANKEKYQTVMDAIYDLENGDYERKWNNLASEFYDSGGLMPGRKVFGGKAGKSPNPHVAELHGSGGLLRGIGGIKATTEDEMVLPPEMTKGLLTAQKSGAFDALLGSLGIVTAAAESVAGIGGGSVRNSIGSQHNGDVYELGSISLSESQARGMTVYDLAQMARGLSLRNA